VRKFLTPVGLEGKEVMLVMQQTANDVDQVKRASSPNFICAQSHGLTCHCRKSIEGEPP
jgi:hypothetical protein